MPSSPAKHFYRLLNFWPSYVKRNVFGEIQRITLFPPILSSNILYQMDFVT